MIDIIDVKKIEESGADPKVLEVYRLLKKYREQPARAEWLKQAKTNWEASHESKIWTDQEEKEIKDKGMIPLAINDLYKGVQGSSAIATANKPGVQYLPIGSGDLYVAELMKRAHDLVWAQNGGQSEIYALVKEAKVGGLGTIEAKHDPGKGRDIYGKVVFGCFDPEYLYYDMKESRKPSLEDTHIIKAQMVTKEYAKEIYDLDDKDLSFEGVEKVEGPQGKDNYNPGEDNYVGADKPVPQEDDDKKEVWEIEAHLLKRVVSFAVVIPDPEQESGIKVLDFPRKNKADAEVVAGKYQTKVIKRVTEKRFLRVVVGRKLINDQEIENPYGMDSQGDPILNIVTLVHDRAKTGRPVCPTNFALEATRERNKRRMQSIYIASKNATAPIQITEGYRFEDKGGETLLVLPKTAPFPATRLLAGTSIAESFQLEQVAKRDNDEMYDVQDVMKGKIPEGMGSQLSGRLVLALQDASGTMSKPFIGAEEAAIARLGTVIMALILKHWSRAMWERLIEADEWEKWQPDEEKNIGQEETQGEGQGPQPDVIKMKWQNALERVSPSDPNKQSALDMLDVDVRVAAGSTLPTNRMAKQEVAGLMVDKGIYDARAALDYIDDPKAEEIATRIEAQNQAMMQAGMTKK